MPDLSVSFPNREGYLDDLLARLPERHRLALEWFRSYAGTERPWPKPLADGTFLASRAKGIYKPGWTEYALSVKETIGGPYPDREPNVRPDGTWSYLYSQEGEGLSARDSLYTNRGLIKCREDQVPVGVIRQVSARPQQARYRVLGLALVAGWDGGYFFLEGFAPDGRSRGRGPAAEIEVITAAQEQAITAAGVFSPEGPLDGRERALASIVRRRGQPQFRRGLLEAYEGRCAISGFDAEEALEAAHIVPYRGPETNHPSNGLLLRADLHSLFDLGLISVDTSTMTIIVAPRLLQTSYGALSGTALRIPNVPGTRPSVEALAKHREWSGL